MLDTISLIALQIHSSGEHGLGSDCTLQLELVF